MVPAEYIYCMQSRNLELNKLCLHPPKWSTPYGQPLGRMLELLLVIQHCHAVHKRKNKHMLDQWNDYGKHNSCGVLESNLQIPSVGWEPHFPYAKDCSCFYMMVLTLYCLIYCSISSQMLISKGQDVVGLVVLTDNS